ncbi:Spermine synthase [Cellulomonas flavigena DSM 20109]|uniref:Polyamine aminopropyltransferase n=1 Tax=Cellulomonas flavigena (strain ATCC 482 / DSM 20109 / BCRC 11376 / JCM 18109 / NBRC 3775 / NCIMB 8073 / NRS 134) TaxID=446466 RepID=D5UDB9_CELFN|nr:polyamine aminopropyltransferase [Cellulomonas flavigena]ADG76375.1 Spermine synthase [Cellulomonas flavigena DSM 20109]
MTAEVLEPPAAPPAGGRRMDRPTVFAAALLVAVGGIVYELILGTAASYLVGDSVVAFSVATGVTLFGMGLGSLLAPHLPGPSGIAFVRNELALGLVGGSSVLVLFWAYGSTTLYWPVFVLLSLAIGTGIGVEIPLLMALLREHGRDGSVRLLSRVLALDYLGALLASLLFPFVLLPTLGLVRTALAVAILNVGVALFMLARMGHRPRWTWATSSALVVLLAVFVVSSGVEAALSTRLYEDPVVAATTSRYQKIVVTDYQGDVRLYLNDQLQFSSSDEARYHETLAHTALTSVAAPASVAILGGGDGLLAREVLRYPSVRDVVVVDLDPAVTDLARTNRLVRDLNEGALDDPRVTVVNADAFAWVRGTDQTFDAVLVDLVDPSNERVAKLYSQEFYQAVAAHLRPGGVMSTQATSTFFTPRAFWQVVATMEAGDPTRTVVPLGVNVPSFGEWGFALSLPGDGDALLTSTPPPDGLRFHDAASLAATTRLPGDLPPRGAAPSTLLSPRVHTTYQRDMEGWRY